jgi:2-methylisocitrate lyase-like PEP mutase family enzyme
MSVEQAVAFGELHVSGEPLRLLNAWDAGSARLFQRAGARALGTTSAGVAFALGRPDGQRITRDELVDAVERIAAAVDVPVSADIEAGFGASPNEVGETVRRVIATGAVGVNIEDVGDGGEPLRSLPDQVACLEAARAAAEREGVPLFVNGRTDVYLLGVGAEQDRLAHASERLRAYVEAGADGVFVPGVADPKTIAALVAATPAPLNVLAGPQSPSVGELAALGVARVSVGSGPSRATLALLQQIAREYLEDGTLDTLDEWSLPYDDANRLFG